MDYRILGPGDAGVLDRVADGVFDNEVNPAFAAEFLGDPRHHICVALDSGVVVGFGSAVHCLHPDKRPQLWINEVGVADSHLKRGIAKAIVERLIAFGAVHGATEAWVLADEKNDAARALYRALGGEETTGVVMVTFRAKAPS